MRTKKIRRLTAVPAHYPLWVVALSVLIFMGPNLLVLLMPQSTDMAAPPMSEISPIDMTITMIITIVLQLGMFGLSLLPLLIAGRPFSRLFGVSKATPVQWALGLAAGIASVVLAYAVNIPLVAMFGDDEPVQQDVMEIALAGGIGSALAIFIAVVLAPVTEEIVFRGILHRALADKIGVALGGVISAAIFAGIHIEVAFSQPLALGGLFVIGAVLAYAYHFTGSLVVPIVGHVVYNGVSVMLALAIQNFFPEMAFTPLLLWPTG